MDYIDKYEGITHKIIIPDGVNDSLQFSILTCFMINTSALLKVGDETSKHDFLTFIGKRLNNSLEYFEGIFKSLKQTRIEDFSDIIPMLFDKRYIFYESNLLFIDTPEASLMYLLSKTLNIMIIIKNENFPDDIYCCSNSKKPLKILIIREESNDFNYFPGVNLEDLESGNVFYKYEAKPIDENIIVFKLFKKNLIKIINSLEEPQKDQLLGLIKGKKSFSFSEKSLNSLESRLKRRNECESHKNKVIYQCGTMHCKICLEIQLNNNRYAACSCGFSKQKYFKSFNWIFKRSQKSITKMVKDSNITIPSVEEQKKEIFCFGCWEILVGNAFNTCPEHFICEKCSKEIPYGGVICVPCEYCPDHIYFPRAINMEGKYAHDECFQKNKPNLQEDPVFQCWGCLNLFQESNIIKTCGSEHFLCNRCFQYFENFCSPCFNLWCAVCNLLILKPFAVNYNGKFYHQYCTQYLVRLK